MVNNNDLIGKLKQRISTSQLPQDVLGRLQDELSHVDISLRANQFGPETDRTINYINFICDLPWEKSVQDILDLQRAKQILDKNHYGLEPIKERILEYLSVLILNKQKGQLPREPILGFVGLVGSGKTSLAFSIAESLGRPIIRIPFGGLGSALQLRGESRIKAEAEPGLIMKSLKRAGVLNPVILLDELDRVTEEARNDIMGVLVELLDPEQNMAFFDHYVGFPFNLSQVLFIATANNIGNIATAVMDRIEVLEMPFYSDEQKITIGREYLLPQALDRSGIDGKLIQVDPQTWPAIVRPLGFDGGIRSLGRNIDALVRKLAKKIVEGQRGPFIVNSANLGEYLSL
ncbi:AAA family ATPase [Candidatus Daviesbacteria bacterium]|nr:AAA family ATPase [Candidatus Daviesbacteria bacterium]